MVTDKQVRRLMKLINTEDTIATAASKAGMDEKTARKYFRLEKLPSEIARPHTWRTRKDPFEDVWDGVQGLLEINPGLEAKTIFDDLQRRYAYSSESGHPFRSKAATCSDSFRPPNPVNLANLRSEATLVELSYLQILYLIKLDHAFRLHVNSGAGVG